MTWGELKKLGSTVPDEAVLLIGEYDENENKIESQVCALSKEEYYSEDDTSWYITLTKS